MSKRFALVSVLIIVSMLVSGCAQTTTAPTTPTTAPVQPTAVPAPTDPPVAAKVEVVIADAIPSITLDPHKSGHTPLDNQVVQAIHDKLVGYKDGIDLGEIEGRLATEWSVSPDGLVWTFKLRKGVVWQGGYGPFTADDVVFTYERLRDPERSQRGGLVAGILKSVRAVDDYTIEMELEAPTADFLYQVPVAFSTGSILSRKALEAIGDADYALKPIGTGPYRLVERQVGGQTIIERNPDFWGSPPQVERFVLIEIPEEAVRADALEAGKIDIGSFRSPVTIERLLKNESVAVDITYDRPCLLTLYINENTVPDVRVREAIYRAIDKHEMADTVLKYRSNPNVVSFLPPGLFGFPEDRTEELYPYDPQRAKNLLAEAGISPGQLTLRFPTRADFAEFSEAIKGYLEAIGIKTDLQVQENAVFNKSRSSMGADFDIIPSNPSRASTSQLLAFMGSPNQAGHQYEAGIPARVAELYTAQSREMDPQRRKVLIQEMLDIVEKDIPWAVFGYAASAATAHPAYVSGPFDNLAQEFSVPFEWIKVDQQLYVQWVRGK